MKITHLSLISLVLILGVFLSGCSSTVVKYQCADGSFMDSAESCAQVNSQTNCPELDCNACGVKVSTKEVIKYQCNDGSIKDSISSCPKITNDVVTPQNTNFILDNHKSAIGKLIETEKASVSKIVFNSGVLEIEYTSQWAGEDMVVREEFDIFKKITEQVKNTEGISKIKVSSVASMGDIYTVELSFKDSLKTINYEMGFEDWKGYVRG